MAINFTNFLYSQNKKSKIGDFQDLEHIDGQVPIFTIIQETIW